MEEDDCAKNNSIDASPTHQNISSSKRSQRSRWQKTSTTRPISETQLQCEIAILGDLDSCLELREAQLFVADRLDCLRAQQEPVRERLVPASQNFNSLQFLLQNDQLPLENEKPEHEGKVEEHMLSPPISIVQEIFHDFCGSPSYVEEDLSTSDDAPPWFRFRDKQIKTYSRHVVIKRSPVATTSNEDDDRLSCSSELSVQEDFTTQVPTTTLIDANCSQKICENLFNLSAFFTQQNNANTSVDLPDIQIEIKDSTLLEPIEYNEVEDDATDVLEEIGYLIGNTEQCKYFDDNCDNKTNDSTEFSLFNERTRMLSANTPSKENNSKDTHLCGDWFNGDFNPQKLNKMNAKDISPEKETTKGLLDGIPLSEWQPLDIEDSTKKQTNLKAEVESDAFNEWQTMDIPDAINFRTASNKKLEVSAEKQKEAAKLMADLEASFTHNRQESINDEKTDSKILENIEFRTASNKTMQLTEAMRKKAAMLMADLEANTVIQQGANKDCNQLNKTSAFQNASDEIIEMTQQKQISASNLMLDLDVNNLTKTDENASDIEMLEGIPLSEWQPMDIPNSLKHEIKEENNSCNQLDAIAFSEWQPMDLSDEADFCTVSNKAIEISEENQAAATKLMADLKTCYSQENMNAIKPHSEIPGNVEFRTASNKIMKLSEEMEKKAAMLMSDLETECNQWDKVHLIDCQSPHRQEPTEIHTASNKTINVSEEKPKEEAQLIADVKDSCSGEIIEATDTHLYSEIPETIGFRTASKKSMKLSEEMLKKAAVLMADLETNCNQSEEIQLRKTPPQSLPKTFDATSNNIKEEKVKACINVLTDVQEIPNPLCEAKIGNTSCSFIKKQNVYLMTATPKQPQKATLENPLEVPFETPKCTPELEASLTQLTERSPLDRATKSSIITRRNLLSLNKRRKLKRDSENCSSDASQTPVRLRFAPTAASTSTPVPSQKENIKDDLHSHAIIRDRSCSQDSPRVQRSRVGKRRSEDALSPIYAPTHKTRRLGLSRVRNKSSHDI